MNALLFALTLILATDGRDRGATLGMGATALHHEIAAKHPGPLNPEDPGFAVRNDAQLKRSQASNSMLPLWTPPLA